MATEMVLVPKNRYEQLNSDDKLYQDKINYYITMLRDNGINFTEPLKDVKTPALNDDENVSAKADAEDVQVAGPPMKDPDTGVKGKEEHTEVNGVDWSNAVVTASPMDIVSKLPEKHRLYGKRLLEYIKKHGQNIVGWSEDGELIYHGKIMAKTNIVPLVGYIFKSDGKPPHGLKDFKKSLKEIRTPKSFLKPFLLKPPGIPKNIKNNWTRY
jgi:hypothetical protein